MSVKKEMGNTHAEVVAAEVEGAEGAETGEGVECANLVKEGSARA